MRYIICFHLLSALLCTGLYLYGETVYMVRLIAANLAVFIASWIYYKITGPRSSKKHRRNGMNQNNEDPITDPTWSIASWNIHNEERNKAWYGNDSHNSMFDD